MEHCFNVGIAKKYGVDAAILLSGLLFITGPDNYYDFELITSNGEFWAKISVDELTKIMPYMSKKKIRKAIKLLSENGLILVEKLSASEFDNTNWYAVTRKGVKTMIESQNERTK